VQASIFKLTGYRQIRSLLLFLSDIFPVVIVCLFIALILANTRQSPLYGLLTSTTGGAISAAFFHYFYVIPVWANHDSAIWYLDNAAFKAGFTITALIYGMLFVLYRICCTRT
jgi:hypothetical protein